MDQNRAKSLPKGANMHQIVTKRTQKGTPRKQLHENTTENTPLGALSPALEAFLEKSGEGFGTLYGTPMELPGLRNASFARPWGYSLRSYQVNG